jgi:hypothetical protein
MPLLIALTANVKQLLKALESNANIVFQIQGIYIAGNTNKL